MDPNQNMDQTAPGHHPRRPQPYKFTADEIRVLKECNRESFYQRCVPFATILGGATFLAVKTGRLPGSPRFGAAPKVAVAVIAGYILGKYSYHKKCSEKFMALPNSKIGDMIRRRKHGEYDDNLDASINASSLGPFGAFTDAYSDISQSSSDYDYDKRPPHEGLDDSFRPSLDNPIVVHDEELPPEQKHVTTYDELRKKNREEYDQTRLSNYREFSKPKTSLPPKEIPKETDTIGDYKPPTGTKNKYGDIWG